MTDIDELERRAEDAQENLMSLIEDRGYGHLIEDKPTYSELEARLENINDEADREALLDQHETTATAISDLSGAMSLRHFSGNASE